MSAGDGESEILGALVARVRQSREYRSVACEVISAIGRIEVTRSRSFEAAVKATKRKLHQIAGAYLPAGMTAGRWRSEIDAARSDELAAVCRRIMACHLSTVERLPFLDEFYRRLLGDMGPVRSMMDVGCGLNPLAIPWIQATRDCTCWAYDIFDDLALMLNTFFRKIDFDGHAEARDVIRRPPTEEVDVALVLKLLPCLDQVTPGAGERLLDAVTARWLVVSFPVHSLCGRRDKGMSTNYQAGFLRMAQERGWQVERFVFPSELVFRVKRP